MLFDELNYTNAVGAGGFLLSLIAYCIIRRIDIGGQSPSRLYCNARTCFIAGLLKLGIGIFEITYFNSSGGMWWGWLLIIFGMFWLIRGNRYRNHAASMSAGYQSFDDDDHASNPPSSSRRRASSGPQIIIVSESANALQQRMIDNARYDDANRVIHNAVPPSPFSGTQGTDSYCIPMEVTSHNINVSDTPRMYMTRSTVGNACETCEEENETEPHAEDSVYLEEKDIDEDDDKNEIEVNVETPNGPVISTALEGNVTFS
eukprot:242068_1